VKADARTQALDVPLWPDRPRPSMRVVLPARPSSDATRAIVVFRGGAYASSSGSGAGTAEWIATKGMVGIEAAYGARSTNTFYPANYADGARAIRLVRSRAREWGVDERRVAVLGYSAGGHLASLISTQPLGYLDPRDELAPTISARPDLVVLGYPVISFVDGYSPGAFVGSVENFFGQNNPNETLRQQFSNELHVESGHPPVFIWTTADDALVPFTHSKLFAEACGRAHVPVEFTLFPHGPHGMGLALEAPNEARGWTTKLLAWLAQQWGEPEPTRSARVDETAAIRQDRHQG
jgi:acetyl esterase/lipase